MIPPKNNAEFAADEVLEVYEKPYNAANLVICMDERPVQLIKESRQRTPATENHPRRIGDIDTLQREIGAWSIDVNERQRGVEWRMKISDARFKLKFVYPKIKF
ncbi:hypothetical protein QUF90_10235 [Desulfococcaceae bacterium HSG9]|nr:hypothetical protein [Desulfococcaceae bacterium HSG9]